MDDVHEEKVLLRPGDENIAGEILTHNQIQRQISVTLLEKPLLVVVNDKEPSNLWYSQKLSRVAFALSMVRSTLYALLSDSSPGLLWVCLSTFPFLQTTNAR